MSSEPPKKDPRVSATIGEARLFILDHSTIIGQAFNREYLWEIEAKVIHRMGLRTGMGFMIPPARDGIDFIQVYHPGDPRLFKDDYTMVFMQFRGHDVPPKVVRARTHISHTDLKSVFEEETTNAVPA